MEEFKNIKIALLGSGTVGTGVYKLIERQKEELPHKIGANLSVSKVLVRDKNKKREGINPEHLTDQWEDIITDDDIQIIVEVMGGIEPARTYITQALQAGKNVVTANKDLMAVHGGELLDIATENGCDLLFEASVAGGIPIIRPLKQCLAGNYISEVMGIVNGTTNFILTLMENENLDFDAALSIADGLGYVEANPALDLDGIDAAHKICILAQNGYQKFVDFDQIQASGIRNVTKLDMDYAKKLGYRFKMIAQAKPVKDGLGIDVSATLVNLNELVANVMDSYNVVEIDNDYVNNIIYYGRGAGRYVTASAVVSDIMKTHQVERWSHDYEDCKHVYPISSSRYYVRASKPVDIPYETYYSEKDDHIYITEEIELADLKNKLNDENAVIFKVRG